MEFSQDYTYNKWGDQDLGSEFWLVSQSSKDVRFPVTRANTSHASADVQQTSWEATSHSSFPNVTVSWIKHSLAFPFYKED